MKPPEGESCSNCYFAVSEIEEVSVLKGMFASPEKKQVEKFACRRYAPITFRFKEGNNVGDMFQLSERLIAPDYWCGEWKRRGY